MAEKVVIGNAELWHGDCREVLPLVLKHDLLLTDPPYEIGDGWHGDFAGKNGKAAMWGKEPEWDRLCADGLLSAVEKCARLSFGAVIYTNFRSVRAGFLGTSAKHSAAVTSSWLGQADTELHGFSGCRGLMPTRTAAKESNTRRRSLAR